MEWTSLCFLYLCCVEVKQFGLENGLDLTDKIHPRELLNISDVRILQTQELNSLSKEVKHQLAWKSKEYVLNFTRTVVNKKVDKGIPGDDTQLEHEGLPATFGDAPGRLSTWTDKI